MKIDINKTYQTRSGEPVEIYRTNGAEPYPIIGARESHGGLKACSWRDDGTHLFRDNHPFDLVEVKVTHVRYVNMNKSGHLTREAADSCASKDRIACVRVEYEEGQFDE